MEEISIVYILFLIFTGAAILATLALSMRQSLIIAYIALGLIIGPWGLNILSDAGLIQNIANVGAKLETERAEADKQLRQAEAEGRRAMAVAREQEMRALVQENQAKVVLAEAEVPRAMADAFRSGNLGIMDYYRMKNIQADTGMRDTIARGGEEEK